VERVAKLRPPGSERYRAERVGKLPEVNRGER